MYNLQPHKMASGLTSRCCPWQNMPLQKLYKEYDQTRLEAAGLQDYQSPIPHLEMVVLFAGTTRHNTIMHVPVTRSIIMAPIAREIGTRMGNCALFLEPFLLIILIS